MAEFISWVQGNWATIIGSVVAVVGVFFTMVTFRQSAEKADREDYTNLAEQHQVLWKEARDREDLKRICQPLVDLDSEPITLVERLYLNEIFIYFESGWKLAQRNTVLSLKAYTTDVLVFFAFPLPHAAWEQSKAGRNPKFVRFIARAIEQHGRENNQ
jgi:hypothetical protein